MSNSEKWPVLALLLGIISVLLGVDFLSSAWYGVVDHAQIHFKSAWLSPTQASIAGVLLILMGFSFLTVWWRERRQK